ncbi:M14 family zinc carboxypeptidase [Nocardia sputorum]|uniref:Zinc carboxypeptidase n=1 Tax=Nocardia sputorum TaxID=2984338 RepID=A0ABM8CWR9_9NOCA|nr:M14 family zinc carboxypeptidase [Nocardia sputorum]BDT99437.1 zinc carboxypeptidase [Nocardia sputorum]
MTEMDRRTLLGLAAVACTTLTVGCGREDTPDATDEVARIVGPVEPLDAFPTVDELNAEIDRVAAAAPDRLRVIEIGRSRAGDPIRAVQVGTGERNILVFGSPHANEPIGMATIAHLVGRLSADETLSAGATWHFVLCIDPDGTRLNEGWFAGPRTRTDVARHFYRPTVTEQPEWAFPITWRGTPVGTPMPETRALMTLIDRTRPAFIASLHNADFGGGFFYTSGGDQSYWSALTDSLTAADVPIHTGAPDAPGGRAWAPGVFEVPTFDQMATALTEAGVDPVAALGGGGSRDYAAPYGTAVLVCELPLWVDPRIADETPSARPRGDVFAATATAYRELAATVRESLDRVADRLDGSTALERSVRATLADLPDMAAEKEAATEPDRPATLGEIFVEDYVWLGMFRLRMGGMMCRVLDDLATRRPDDAQVAAERERFGAIFDGWSGEIERHAPGQPVPLERLVEIQARAIVTAALRSQAGQPI